ncbi:MAG TPA: aldo/keto reductase, partial [Spirochaetia bacterium]|nr:aldo/keto reductase [Spirochaetia bacterium]
LIHWPTPGMILNQMMSGLARVVASGKARYVGCCNFPAWVVGSSNLIAAENGWPKLSCNQVAYNLIERGVEVEVLPQAVTEGLFITAYRPLAIGLLTGTFRSGKPLDPAKRGTTDPRVITWLSQHGGSIERFIRHCEARGYEPAQAATAWINRSPAIGAPIVGASSPAQVEAAAASTEISLTDEEYRDITDLFDTEVKEEGLQLFPGLKYNYPRLRRTLFLAKRE